MPLSRHLILLVKTNQEMVLHWEKGKQMTMLRQSVSADDLDVFIFSFLYVYIYIHISYFLTRLMMHSYLIYLHHVVYSASEAVCNAKQLTYCNSSTWLYGYL